MLAFDQELLYLNDRRTKRRFVLSVFFAVKQEEASRKNGYNACIRIWQQTILYSIQAGADSNTHWRSGSYAGNGYLLLFFPCIER